MSLADSFERFWYYQLCDGANTEDRPKSERAFYAGAEATLNYCNLTSPKAMQMVEHEEIQAEIDHFRSHK